MKSLFETVISGFGANSTGKNSNATRVSGKSFAPAGSSRLGPKVLVAKLEGDQDGQILARLSKELESLRGWEIFNLKSNVKLPNKGNLVSKLAAAASMATDWMVKEDADLLVWGEVSDGEVKLHFQSLMFPTETIPGTFTLGDCLILPLDLDEDMMLVVRTAAAAAVGPLFRGPRTKFGDMMEAHLEDLTRILNTPSANLTAYQQASLFLTLGTIFAAQTRLGCPSSRLDLALIGYEKSKNLITAKNHSAMWVVTQSHIAEILKYRGERKLNDGGDDLHKACRIYQEIHEALDPNTHGDDWAQAHLNEGNILYHLGHREGNADRYKDAITSYKYALQEYTRAAVPWRWAEVQNEYGKSLFSLGEMRGQDQLLKEAIVRFKGSLEVRTLKRSAEFWAQTSNNLGAVAFSLGNKIDDIGLLKEAERCFEDSIAVYRKLGAKKKADRIASNLRRVNDVLERPGLTGSSK